MPKRKYGFWNEDKLKGGVGFYAITPQEALVKEFEEFKEWCFKEIQGFKEELRELRRKIDEVEGQVV